MDIINLAGGHLFVLLTACFHAWEGPKDLLKIEEQTRQDLELYFQNEWQGLSPAEREVLRDPVQAGLQEASNPAIAIILRDLTHKCLLVRRGETYDYTSKTWVEFISANRQPRISDVGFFL